MTQLGSLRRWAAFALVPLVAAAALALGPRAGEAQSQSFTRQHRALFPLCSGPARVTCVVDGDTIWLSGAKIRIADIDSPEISRPGCEREAMLGRRATERLRQLLNAGPFTLLPPPDGRTEDRYGRQLRLIHRNGESLGEMLVKEGLAVRWGGPRARWCGV
jgi:endonuclease YncB( thermonuclease family)